MKTTHQHIPALERTFDGIPRCPHHPGELLTHDGRCPRCEREERMAAARTMEEELDARRLLAMTRVTAGKRRAA